MVMDSFWRTLGRTLAFTLSKMEIHCRVLENVHLYLYALRFQPFGRVSVTWPELGNPVDLREHILRILYREGDRNESGGGREFG